jgi:apolipoprotein D and lipocalin family protein
MHARVGRLVLLTTLVLIAGCQSPGGAPKTASHVDLARYMGDWYVIANIPYFAEKGCFDSIESYALRTDGDIDNWFTCRKDSFAAPLKRKVTALATVKDTHTNATWRVRFFGVISVRYLILDVDPDYQWAAIAHPSRKYGWILARSKSLDPATYAAILQKFAHQGYDPTKFEQVPQRAVQP